MSSCRTTRAADADRRGRGAVTLLPRSLFGRLALLLLAVVAVALVATILFFRQDRADAARAAVQRHQDRAAAGACARRSRRNDTPERREIDRPDRRASTAFASFPKASARASSGAPVPPPLEPLAGAPARSAGRGHRAPRGARSRPPSRPRRSGGRRGYWVGFPLPPRAQAEDHPSRAALWSLIARRRAAGRRVRLRALPRASAARARRDRRARRPRRDAAAAARSTARPKS